MVPAAVLKERFPQRIMERTDRGVTHGDTYRHAVRQFRVGTDIPVELTVPLNTLTCPGTVVRPRETLQRKGRAMVCPVHHVLCGVHPPFLHPEEVGTVLVMTRIDIHGTIVYHRGRVTGTPRLYERILSLTAESPCCQ